MAKHLLDFIACVVYVLGSIVWLFVAYLVYFSPDTPHQEIKLKHRQNFVHKIQQKQNEQPPKIRMAEKDPPPVKR